MLPREFIIIHHSLTKDGVVPDWPAIETFHTSYRQGGTIITEEGYYALKAQHATGLEPPWSDVGYHAGVELEAGRIVAHLGRSWLDPAAACPQDGMNQRGLHVCCVGNYDLVAPSDAMLEVLLRRVLRPWMRMFNIPATRIAGHRDFNPAKSCPGRLFDLDRLRRMAA